MPAVLESEINAEAQVAAVRTRGPLAAWWHHPWLAALVVVVVAASSFLVGLNGPGLWEPQELAIADSAVAELDGAARDSNSTPATDLKPNAATPSCQRTIPKDALARSAARRSTTAGIRYVGGSDFGMRAPNAMLGIVLALAIFGIGARVAAIRAGLLAALCALAMPIVMLPGRQLLGDMASMAGGTLMVYGLCALGLPRGRGAWQLLDLLTALALLSAGSGLAFVGGGLFLGVLAPLGACAAATGFGVPALRAAWHKLRPKHRAAASADTSQHVSQAEPRHAANAPFRSSVGAFAALSAIAVLAVLTYQMYSIKNPITGGREILGKSIVPSGCYSWALGAIWPGEDNLRQTFESNIEQIAFGSFPWGILAPVAIAALLLSPQRGRQRVGALALAWGATSWIVVEAFARKVGPTMWCGAPALALAVGVWLDAVWTARATRRGQQLLGDQAPAAALAHQCERHATDRTEIPAASLLVGLFGALGILVIAKDVQQFPERLTSLLIGNDAVKYPVTARAWGLPAKAWVMVFGLILVVAFATTMWVYAAESQRRRTIGNRALWLVCLMTVPLSWFWSHGWHRGLSARLSSKQIFATFAELRDANDKLYILGEMGNAPRYYAGAPVEKLAGYEHLFTTLAKPERVFAMVPGPELCAIHREAAGRPYVVLDDSSTRALLVSNQANGSADRNPLARAVLRREPSGIAHRPSAPIVYDNKIELIGWDLPAPLSRGSTITVKLYFKVLAPIAGAYKVFLHIDGAGLRMNGDHEPINGRCATSFWKPGDYIVDEFSLVAGGPTFPAVDYEVWAGFFTGGAGTWRNMPVSTAPPQSRDNADRVKLTTVRAR